MSRRMLIRLKQGRGSVSLNNRLAESLILPLHEGDTLSVALEETSLPFESNHALFAPVLYEDDDLIVFDKPPGMPVHPSHLHRDDTLANCFAAICEKAKQTATFHAINRLDRDTSGACLVAKHPYAASLLSGKVDKVYLAACVGVLSPPNGTIDAPILRAEESIILRKTDPNGKPAITHYKTIASNGSRSLCRVILETGRTHQIRVHFASIGHPLLGDDLYGGDRMLISRQALHCASVSFLKPGSSEQITVFAPLPDDIASLFPQNQDT